MHTGIERESTTRKLKRDLIGQIAVVGGPARNRILRHLVFVVMLGAEAPLRIQRVIGTHAPVIGIECLTSVIPPLVHAGISPELGERQRARIARIDPRRARLEIQTQCIDRFSARGETPGIRLGLVAMPGGILVAEAAEAAMVQRGGKIEAVTHDPCRSHGTARPIVARIGIQAHALACLGIDLDGAGGRTVAVQDRTAALCDLDPFDIRNRDRPDELWSHVDVVQSASINRNDDVLMAVGVAVAAHADLRGVAVAVARRHLQRGLLRQVLVKRTYAGALDVFPGMHLGGIRGVLILHVDASGRHDDRLTNGLLRPHTLGHHRHRCADCGSQT